MSSTRRPPASYRPPTAPSSSSPAPSPAPPRPPRIGLQQRRQAHHRLALHHLAAARTQRRGSAAQPPGGPRSEQIHHGSQELESRRERLGRTHRSRSGAHHQREERVRRL